MVSGKTSETKRGYDIAFKDSLEEECGEPVSHYTQTLGEQLPWGESGDSSFQTRRKVVDLPRGTEKGPCCLILLSHLPRCFFGIHLLRSVGKSKIAILIIIARKIIFSASFSITSPCPSLVYLHCICSSCGHCLY